ncbi:IS1 family transposase [Methanofollis fontis]|uniref:Transcription factor IIB n=1 Tax=Methanofollis fontis TaxID=2052832 RepID=A0A483CTR9_9EURY|nr:IS1 family transposase [Methanofollis fontis]TAJ44803.1 transcription factor IIB [Methanofollis fontis]
MLRCPQCGSTDLYTMIGGYGGFRYRCKQCGYIGSFVLESDEELPSPVTRPKESEEKKIAVPLWLKIVVALLVLYMLLYLLILIP